MSEATMPATLEPHQSDYKPDAWRDWTYEELGHAVAFFAKRATHRREGSEKQLKDLYDAGNYLKMLEAKLVHQTREAHGKASVEAVKS